MYLLVLVLGMLLICSCGTTDTDTETSTESDTATEAVDTSTNTTTDTATDDGADTGTDTATESIDNSIDTQEGESDTETETNTKTDVDSETSSEKNNNDSTPSNLSVAEKRNLKVSFNMDKEDVGGVSDGRLIAIMGENEDGNARIEYSPNAYQFYVSILCQDKLDEALSVIEAQIEEHFDGYAYGGSPTTVIDVIKNSSSNTATILFPDFDSYYLCQENMLNGLSEKDSVLSIEVGYFDAQNGTRKPKSTYEYINVGSAFEEDRYIASYEEFTSLFSNRIENNE